MQRSRMDRHKMICFHSGMDMPQAGIFWQFKKAGKRRRKERKKIDKGDE